ncbi:MAG: STAS domain-containing protein [Lachnospiraceae bacterium]|nr:STAS domain-containing protein [Lachnospiraceae bacterium]
MLITETKGDNSIQLSVDGNVDTNTAPQLQTQILQAFQKSSHVILEMSKCPYMSSAGLRALLIGQKTATSKGGSLKICNVQPVVSEVFKMSGFATILTIV